MHEHKGNDGMLRIAYMSKKTSGIPIEILENMLRFSYIFHKETCKKLYSMGNIMNVFAPRTKYCH